jgi:uncharacterized protein YktA (UPF0223 family)
LLYWFVFEDGIKVIDSSTILIVANGINKEIRLQGVCSTGTEQKDKKAELLIRQLLEGKRSEIRVYGKNEKQMDSAVLLVDGININKKLISKGYVSTGKQCGTEYTSDEKFNTVTSSFQADRRSSLSGSSGVDVFYVGGAENDHIQNYYRKNKNHVQDRTKQVARQYSPSSEYSRPKTVYVRGYYRKNGTYVQPHLRSAPRRRR